ILATLNRPRNLPQRLRHACFGKITRSEQNGNHFRGSPGHALLSLGKKEKRESAMEKLMFRDALLKGKRILVTGGGTGLGEVMSEAYAQLGATVYICGRRAGVLEETAKKLSDKTGSAVKPVACDIRVSEAVDDMVGQIWADGGALTGLVNNAAGNF